MFDLSIHPTLRNKPARWSSSYGDDWSHARLSLDQLRGHIQAGGAFIPAQMNSSHRSSSAFVRTDLVCVDIDDGTTIKQLLNHPLIDQACAIYTSSSHQPEAGLHRFRVLFALPEPITDGELAKALLLILIEAFRSDRSCSDPCRIFYGNEAATWPRWEPLALLDGSLIDRAAANLSDAQISADLEVDELTLDRAAWCLEHVIPPTADGERDRFTRITAAARAGGEALLGPWLQWASSGHHGSGKNARQASEKFFRGFAGSSLGTLFFFAAEADPHWRTKLPEELKSSGNWNPVFPCGAVGYEHDEFLDDDEGPELSSLDGAAQTASLFTGNLAALPAPGAGAIDDEADDTPAANAIAPVAATARRPLPRPRRGGAQQPVDLIEEIKTRLRRLYPGLRLNTMSQQLEYGPAHQVKRIADASTIYVRISQGAGQVFAKTLVYDMAQVEAYEHRYHPVKAYLEHCAATADPIPYFCRIATELLGLPDDPITNPSLPNGRKLADVIIERFLIGAVARVYEPGCRHDWIPILIGNQNVGKSTFFQYLTPDDPSAPGTYPWCATVQQGISYIKDRPHTLHAGWIVVLDEIERYFRRQFTEELKNLISTPIDRSARKYENERDFPRAFVLAGAANSADFLVDPTGNRRFMPILVQGVVPSPQNPAIKIIDLDRLKADRERIWAAAYKAYLDQPVHTFSSHELSVAANYLENFGADSAIDVRLARKLETNNSGVYMRAGRALNYVTLSDVFSWLEIPLTAQPQMNVPVSDSLKRLGYRARRISIAGKTQRVWLRLDGPELELEAA